MVQASVQGLLGDLSGVHGKVKRDSGEFQRALGKKLLIDFYVDIYFYAHAHFYAHFIFMLLADYLVQV